MSSINTQRNINNASQNERALMTKLLKQLNITNYEFTPDDGNAIYDGTYYMDNQLVVFEIKVRSFESTKYPDTMLEPKKVRNLDVKCGELDAIPMAFIFFNDDKVAAFNPLSIQPHQRMTKRKKTTCDNYSQYIDEMANFYQLQDENMVIINLNE